MKNNSKYAAIKEFLLTPGGYNYEGVSDQWTIGHFYLSMLKISQPVSDLIFTLHKAAISSHYF